MLISVADNARDSARCLMGLQLQSGGIEGKNNSKMVTCTYFMYFFSKVIVVKREQVARSLHNAFRENTWRLLGVSG